MVYNTVFILVTKIRKQTFISLNSYLAARTNAEKFLVYYNGQNMEEKAALKTFCDNNDIQFIWNTTRDYFSHATLCSDLSKSKHTTILHDDDQMTQQHLKC